MKLRITYVKSSIGYSKSQRATVQSLGLRKLNSVSVREDNNSIRGMIFSVKHLVKVEEVSDDTPVTASPVSKSFGRRFRPTASLDTPMTNTSVVVSASPVVPAMATARPDVAPVVQNTSVPPTGLSDDLEIIEGIGPKIASILRSNGVSSLAQLATTDVEVLNQILQENKLAQIASPTTWPQQAKLAVEGKFDELTALQRDLDGGRAL